MHVGNSQRLVGCGSAQITGLAMTLQVVGMALLILSLVMLYQHSFRRSGASTVPGFGY